MTPQDIVRRSLAARHERSARDGYGSGPLPWGYKRSEAGAIVVDYVPSVIICYLFALRDDSNTYQQTADKLNEAGYQTKSGGRWTTGNVQGIERHEELYRYGIKRWNGVEGAQRWPIIVTGRR